MLTSEIASIPHQAQRLRPAIACRGTCADRLWISTGLYVSVGDRHLQLGLPVLGDRVEQLSDEPQVGSGNIGTPKAIHQVQPSHRVGLTSRLALFSVHDGVCGHTLLADLPGPIQIRVIDLTNPFIHVFYKIPIIVQTRLRLMLLCSAKPQPPSWL
jgi:hypothetical protein